MTIGYTFYEGDDGTQDNLGTLAYAPGANYSRDQPIENDEARSVVLSSGMPAGATLVVYDSPSASLNNDWCQIQVKQTLTSAYTVDTFEQDVNNNDIDQNYHYKNGNLNGKISYISVYAPWPVPLSSATILYQGPQSDLEPSGLTLDTATHTLYMVSDNGKLAAKNLNNETSSWIEQTLSYTYQSKSKTYGFECIALVKGDLMLGVEGADEDNGQPYPRILRFDQNNTSSTNPLGTLTGSEWVLEIDDLDDNGGMEAMTFVPDAYCPSSWGSSSYYGGFFLVALQSKPGTVYVYDLPKGSGKSHTVKDYVASFSTDVLNLKSSDMCFDAGKLYILYDDTFDALQVFNLSKDGITLANQTQPPTKNCEGITVNGTTLYLALDQNSNSKDNYVYQLDQFVLATS